MIKNKMCCTCKKNLSLDSFYTDKNRLDGLKTECKNCSREYLRKYKKTNEYKKYISSYNKIYEENNKEQIRSKQKERYYRKKYGMGTDDVKKLFLLQQEKCAICSAIKPGIRGWHVDHDHKTGKVRGILCGNCNLAIGLFKDKPINFHKAFLYLC